MSMKFMCSRRRVLIALASIGTAGCFDDEDSFERVLVEPPADATGPEHTSQLELAHWMPEGTFESLAAPSERRSPVALDMRWFPDRESLERAVADGMVAAKPPDLVQTVLGEELRRYAEVAEIHALENVFPKDFRSNVGELHRVSERPYALPLTTMPMNVIAVDTVALARNDLEPVEFESYDGFAGAVERLGLGLRDTRTSVFQLLGQVLLSHGGAEAYAAAAQRSLPMRALRAAIERTASLLSTVRWLSPRPTEHELDNCPIVLIDGVVSEAIRMRDRRLLSFPGTEQSVVVNATGLCAPKRGTDPAMAKQVLTTVVDPTVQRKMSERCRRLPGIHSATPDSLSILLERFTTSSSALPAMCTGCGLDTDRRWRILHAIERRAWDDPIALGDTLGAILR